MYVPLSILASNCRTHVSISFTFALQRLASHLEVPARLQMGPLSLTLCNIAKVHSSMYFPVAAPLVSYVGDQLVAMYILSSSPACFVHPSVIPSLFRTTVSAQTCAFLMLAAVHIQQHAHSGLATHTAD